MKKLWPSEVSENSKQISKIQISKNQPRTGWAGKFPPRPGRPGGRPGSRPRGRPGSRPAHQVDMGVDPRVDLGVDLPGRAQATWVLLSGFLGWVWWLVTKSDGSNLI